MVGDDVGGALRGLAAATCHLDAGHLPGTGDGGRCGAPAHPGARQLIGVLRLPANLGSAAPATRPVRPHPHPGQAADNRRLSGLRRRRRGRQRLIWGRQCNPAWTHSAMELPGGGHGAAPLSGTYLLQPAGAGQGLEEAGALLVTGGLCRPHPRPRVQVFGVGGRRGRRAALPPGVVQLPGLRRAQTPLGSALPWRREAGDGRDRLQQPRLLLAEELPGPCARHHLPSTRSVYRCVF